MDSNQFTQQLVEFSQVEQQINTNTNLQDPDRPGLDARPAPMPCPISARRSRSPTATPRSTNGAGEMDLQPGRHRGADHADRHRCQRQGGLSPARAKPPPAITSFNWDGKDNNGNQLADGTYKLTVSAAAADGSAVTTQVASAGVVSEVDMTGGTPQLMIGPMEIGSRRHRRRRKA